MLVLTRKSGETVIMDGRITIHVLGVSGDRVQLGLEAPEEMAIVRPDASDIPPTPQGGEDPTADEIDELCLADIESCPLECSDPEARDRWLRLVADQGWLLDDITV